MAALTSFVDALRQLVGATFGTWWRTLPRVLTALTLGWLAYLVLTQLAALAVQVSAWLALALMALAFVATLSALVISLRILGQDLGIREAVPLAQDDPRDTSVSHLLALTLLPFLGIYAAFNKVTEAATRLQTDYYLFYGVSFENPLLAQLNPSAEGTSLWAIVGLIVSLYLIRRGFDAWFDKTGWRSVGLGSALIEGFFMFLIVLSGRQLAITIGRWVDERAFRQWLDYPRWGLTWAFERLHVDIREPLQAIEGFVADVLVPGLSAAVLEPMLWLAVTALVFGTQVLSVADMWRKGHHVVASTRRGHGVAVGDRGRGVALQLQEAFFGDLNDKYLPTWQSLRLVVGVGATFLGAFVLCYGGLGLVGEGVDRVIDQLLGGRRVEFWSLIGPSRDLLATLVYEPLRLALLATAFRLTLRILAERADPSAPAEAPSTEAAGT